jgi:NAD(P)-dependent dehydrogenase (short-subunit alcohol dehydrogenase family)
MSDLKGKVAVVTGASKGIGIAKGLSAAGAAVVDVAAFAARAEMVSPPSQPILLLPVR